MANGNPDFAEALRLQISILNKVAQTSTDTCTISQSIALANEDVFSLFISKLQAGIVYKGAWCVPRADAYVGVVFDFEVDTEKNPFVFTLLKPWFAVAVDMEFGRVVGIQDPYIPSVTTCPAPSDSGCSCKGNSPNFSSSYKVASPAPSGCGCNDRSSNYPPPVMAQPQDICPPGCIPYQDNCCTWYYDENGFRVCTSACTRCDCFSKTNTSSCNQNFSSTVSAGRGQNFGKSKFCFPQKGYFGINGDNCYGYRDCQMCKSAGGVPYDCSSSFRETKCYCSGSPCCPQGQPIC